MAMQDYFHLVLQLGSLYRDQDLSDELLWLSVFLRILQLEAIAHNTAPFAIAKL